MTMTPYEIRLELLKMAQQMLESEYFSNKDRLTNDWHMRVEAAKHRGEVPPDHPIYPAYPSENDIIAKAQTLNGFVSQIPAPQEKTSKK
jgi:hypothetical protein